MKRSAVSLMIICCSFIAAAAWAQNITLGSSAGSSLTTGVNNVLVGQGAGAHISTASHNTFVGNFSGVGVNTSYNTGIGYYAGSNMLLLPVTGTRNTSIGYTAGSHLTTGGANVFAGYEAGRDNTTGDYNVFVGYDAGYQNTTGSYSTFLGLGAGRANIQGTINTFAGYYAGNSTVDGSRNVYIGNQAGGQNVSGTHNIFIGDHAGEFEPGSYKLYIDPTNTASPLIYGDFLTSTLEVNGQLTASSVAVVSDGRFKQEIRPLEAALAKTMKLNGVTYTWKTEDYSGRRLPEGRQPGLIAQEVELVVPEVVQTDARGYKRVSYEKLIPLLTEAIKEQDKMADAENAKLERLRQRIGQLAGRLKMLSRETADTEPARISVSSR